MWIANKYRAFRASEDFRVGVAFLAGCVWGVGIVVLVFAYGI